MSDGYGVILKDPVFLMIPSLTSVALLLKMPGIMFLIVAPALLEIVLLLFIVPVFSNIDPVEFVMEPLFVVKTLLKKPPLILLMDPSLLLITAPMLVILPLLLII